MSEVSSQQDVSVIPDKPVAPEGASSQDKLNREMLRLLVSPDAITVPARHVERSWQQSELTVACVTEEGIIAGVHTLRPLQSSPDRHTAPVRQSLTNGDVTETSVIPSSNEQTASGQNALPRENQMIHLAIRDAQLGQLFSLNYLKREDGSIKTEAFKCKLPSPDFEEELWREGGFNYRTDEQAMRHDLLLPVTNDDFDRYASILEKAQVDPDLTAKAANYETITLYDN